MARQILVGIDIGTLDTRVVIAEGLSENGHLVPKILGVGSAASLGIYRGYVTNTAEVSKSVLSAVRRAEKSSGLKIRRAYLSFGGVGLSSVIASGTAMISRADLEISERDLTLVLEAAETAIPAEVSLNKKIINT